MKVLFISNPHYADCDFPLIREMQNQGVNITYLIMLAPHSRRSTLLDIKTQIKKNGIVRAIEIPEFAIYNEYMDLNKVFVANCNSSKTYSLQFWEMNLALYQFVKRGGYDIIHSGHMFTWEHSYLYRMCNTWIQMVHDPFPHSGENSIKKNNVYNYVFSHSKKFVLLNEQQVDEFCKKYEISKSDVLINRLGVYDNIKTFAKKQIKTPEKNVLFFGRISPYKGLEYLCEAFVKVHEVLPNASLTIAGGGCIYFDYLPYQNKKYIKLINRYVDMAELAELLEKCSVSVCPYTDATQSGVIMTSFGLEKPVIATNVGGLGEMIDNGKTGILVSERNSKELAEAIITYLTNQKMEEEMIEAIRVETVNGKFSWKRIADKYIKFYKESISK